VIYRSTIYIIRQTYHKRGRREVQGDNVSRFSCPFRSFTFLCPGRLIPSRVLRNLKTVVFCLALLISLEKNGSVFQLFPSFDCEQFIGYLG
jgi:hypothetical protein